MPDVKSGTLRIYCICGQKMKVSEKMYGLPGKCVACRQKIRIPRKDELSGGIAEIHLRDRPEFLRGPARAAPISEEEREARRALAEAGDAGGEGDRDSTPNTELDLVDSPPVAQSTRAPAPAPPRRAPSSIPLDVLPQLRVLCSLDYKLSRQLDTLQLNSHDDEVLLAELEGHIARVRRQRVRLDDYLHQLLMETAIELANTQEKLAQIRLEARVGEKPWVDARTATNRLRARRERLERRQQNLRGWLATNDPYLAGGLLDLSIENIPREDAAVTLPPEGEDDSPQLAVLAGGLREALEVRARVRHRIAEVQRMGDGGREIEELRNETGTQRRLARARVAFHHDRLRQLKKDYESDVETANASLGVARDRLRTDEIAREDYDALEREVLRSKRDIARAQSVISRALAANAASDVPSPRGTLLERLGFAPGSRTTTDHVAAYGAVVALCACIFAPSVGTMSLVGSALEFADSEGAAAWLFIGPLALAGLVAAMGAVHDPALRGRLYLTACLLGSIAGFYLIREGAYGLGSIPSRFRTGSEWALRPGILLYLLGNAAIFAAGTIALWHLRSQRVWPPVAAIVTAAAAMALFTDAFGAFRPQPQLAVNLFAEEAGAGAVRITNAGGRKLYLLARPADSRNSFRILLERRVGASSYAAATGQGPLFEPGAVQDRGLLFTVGPGDAHEIPFVLVPGEEYRVMLDSAVLDVPIVERFAVPGPAPEAAPRGPLLTDPVGPVDPAAGPQAGAGPPANPDGAAAPRESGPAETPPAAANGPQVQLSGIMTTPDESPRFTLDVIFQDGSDERLTLQLNGSVWRDWIVTEFNPDQQTVTLERDGKFRVLRRGEPVALDP